MTRAGRGGGIGRRAGFRAEEWRPSPRRGAQLALLGNVALWGSVGVVIKEVERDGLPPVTLSLLRTLVGGLVLLPLVYRGGNRPALGRGAALLGLTGVALSYAFYQDGLRYSSVDNATMFQGVVPAATAILAAAFLGERLGAWRLGGILVTIVGLLVVVLFGSRSGLGFSALGDLLLLGSALCLAIYNVLGRRAFAGQDTLAVVAGSLLYGTLFLLPFAGLELVGEAATLRHVSGEEVGLVLYLGVGGTALAFLLLGIGLKHLDAGEVAVFGNLIPFVSIASAALVLGEAIGLTEVVGGAIIAAGVWLASRSPQREPPGSTPDRSPDAERAAAPGPPLAAVD